MPSASSFTGSYCLEEFSDAFYIFVSRSRFKAAVDVYAG
jgi:hypothetical protein